MANENGTWIMRGVAWDNPYRIKSWRELVNWVDEVGFLPLFANEVKGFSAEEHVSPNYWWTGIADEDPWEWREIIARSRQVAYGKFFDKKAGFISKDWLPYFANARRDGYDFDARWADGLADRREKSIMDFYMEEDADGDIIWKDEDILSTDLKKKAGFGKGGAGKETVGSKNFPGIVTNLQMSLYLVTADFRRRTNKKGEEYGMAVSIMLPPESVWGYELVTGAYKERPEESWMRIYNQVKHNFPKASENDIIKVIGKCPR